MSKHIKETNEKPTYEQLEEQIHKTFHFLQDLKHSPDADDWLRYHMMVAIRMLNGESLKGTYIYLPKEGRVEIIKE